MMTIPPPRQPGKPALRERGSSISYIPPLRTSTLPNYILRVRIAETHPPIGMEASAPAATASTGVLGHSESHPGGRMNPTGSLDAGTGQSSMLGVGGGR